MVERAIGKKLYNNRTLFRFNGLGIREEKGNGMTKYKIVVVTLLAIMCFGLVSIPNSFSQVSQVTTNIKVLSYSWYVNTAGDLIVVGEVQNTGTSILSSVSLTAAVYGSGTTELVSATGMPYVNDSLPQQKAPFYIDCGNPGAGAGLTASSVSNVEFTITNAPTTQSQQYQGLQIDHTFNETLGGSYIVTGVVFNNGNQTAKGINVVGTFYNSAGKVVAVGFVKSSVALIPGNQTVFSVSEFDPTTSLASQISNYSLLIQTSTLQNSLSTSSSSSPTSSSGSSVLIYIVVGIVVIVVVAAASLIFLRKRRNLPLPPLPPPPPPS